MNRILLLGVLALLGCTDPHEPLSPDFGNAVMTNIDAQVVNPAPVLGPDPGTDGMRVNGAIIRYRTDRVERPQIDSGGTNAPASAAPPAN